eukprot:5473085-Lingulodinium_polyedra.AAC.1
MAANLSPGPQEPVGSGASLSRMVFANSSAALCIFACACADPIKFSLITNVWYLRAMTHFVHSSHA